MNTYSEKIADKDISFIIQGPVITGSDHVKKIQNLNENFNKGHIKDSNVTKKTCESIRKYFPNSHIILSTWKNSNTTGLNFDKKIESDDPGANHYYYENDTILNNTNRMLISSYNGLISVKTKFSVKLRSDMYFQSNNLINLLENVDTSSSLYSKKKIIIPSNMAINPERQLALLFHPSDTFFAGLTDDLIDLFNIPLMSDEQMTFFKNNNSNRKNNVPILAKYTPEQYLFYSFIKKKINIKFENAFDFNKENKSLHDKIFSNLFLMYRNSRIGVNGFKYPMSFFSSTSYYAYTEFEFNKLSGKRQFIDNERILSNIIKTLKLIILFFSKNLYFKIKDYFIKKI